MPEQAPHKETQQDSLVTESATTIKANFEDCWTKKSPGEQKEPEQTRPTLKFALALSGSG